jgi:hypothetical protein
MAKNLNDLCSLDESATAEQVHQAGAVAFRAGRNELRSELQRSVRTGLAGKSFARSVLAGTSQEYPNGKV